MDSCVVGQPERARVVELLVEQNGVDEARIADVRAARDDAADQRAGSTKTSRRRHVGDVRLLEEAANAAVEPDAEPYPVDVGDPAAPAELRQDHDVPLEQLRIFAASRVGRRTEVVVADDAGISPASLFRSRRRRRLVRLCSRQFVDEVVFVVYVPGDTTLKFHEIYRCLL